MPETEWRDVGRLDAADPRHIAGFEVVGRLGAGGMGVVYLADHPDLGRAAVKFLRGGPVDASFRERFRREVAAARRVRSPRVAPVLAADADADTPWLATAFVDGPTLRQAVEDTGPMRGERLVALAVALADALAAIHRADVVHRDLKPANILLTPETPVVIDFGIASLREAPGLTRTGMAVGTPGWMAPEQVRGAPCGPRADVFTWALVVAYAASGRLPFGRGRADALFYRVVHESPTLPDLPEPLGGLVRRALDKHPRSRPDVAELLAALTAAAMEATATATAGATPPGTTAIGATLADRTAIVPTVVALGWGVEALPTRPDGQRRSVVVEPPRRAEAGFWFAGREHHDARSLAAALQSSWDDAVEQVFRRRDPVWVGELQAFLRALDRTEAAEIVGAGTGDAPPAATMARLLPAIDPGIEPRAGSWWLTPEGLAVAAQGVIDGREPGERLSELRTARVLRLWRGLAGMERAAAIDERWHAGTQEFDRVVAAVSARAGWPTPAERHRAGATLLLCAVHPDHERRLERRLAAARRTAARHQPWWAQLASEGQRSPAAAVVAVLTADAARTQALEQRHAARESNRRRRAAERAERQRRSAARAAPPAPRHLPLPRATSGVRRPWVLATMLAVLLLHLWAVATFGDAVVAYYEDTVPGTDSAVDRLDTYRDAASSTWLAALLLVALPAIHAATRAIVRHGATAALVRLYAAVAAGVDLLLGLTLVPVSAAAGVVLATGLAGAARPDAGAPFEPGQPWAVVGLLLPFGLVGVFLIVRSCWRLGRAVLWRPVAGPPFLYPPPAPPGVAA